MSHFYDTWTSGEKISTAILQEIADATGSINNDAFHAEQPSSYLVFKSGSNYYVRNGSDGTIESGGTSTSSSTAINWAIDQCTTGGTVTLKTYPLITLDGTINLDQHGVILQGDSMWTGLEGSGYGSGGPTRGVALADSVDADMVYVTGFKCMIRDLFLYGNKDNQSAGAGIKTLNDASLDLHLRDLYVFHCKEYGMEMLGNFWASACFSEFNVSHNWYLGADCDYARAIACTGTGSTGGDGWYIASGSSQNRLIGCTAASNAGDGITLDGGYNVVDGCMIYNNDNHGIRFYSGQWCTVDGCMLVQNGQGTTNTYSHIYLGSSGGVHSTNNVITNNLTVEPGGTQCKYMIEEADANQDYNVIKDNELAAGATGTALIYGLNDKLHTYIAPFIDGTTYDDQGWDIDLDTEYATAFLSLPEDVQQVVRMNIYAVSVVNEADAMRLQVNVYGGADNEAYNTQSYEGADVASASSNFSLGDVIVWRLTAAGITGLTASDSVSVKVLHEAAGGDDCATDARFRSVEVHYV